MHIRAQAVRLGRFAAPAESGCSHTSCWCASTRLASSWLPSRRRCRTARSGCRRRRRCVGTGRGCRCGGRPRRRPPSSCSARKPCWLHAQTSRPQSALSLRYGGRCTHDGVNNAVAGAYTINVWHVRKAQTFLAGADPLPKVRLCWNSGGGVTAWRGQSLSAGRDRLALWKPGSRDEAAAGSTGPVWRVCQMPGTA